jgi:hypothetical protein
MKQFEAFDPGAWLDDEVFLAEPPQVAAESAPAVEDSLSESAVPFLRRWLVGSSLAAGIIIGSLFVGASLSPGWTFRPRFASEIEAQGTTLQHESSHQGVEVDDVDAGGELWDRVMCHLGAHHQDADSVLKRAARNLNHWRGREAPFPMEELVSEEDV